jgi:hypothetical protein
MISELQSVSISIIFIPLSHLLYPTVPDFRLHRLVFGPGVVPQAVMAIGFATAAGAKHLVKILRVSEPLILCFTTTEWAGL